MTYTLNLGIFETTVDSPIANARQMYWNGLAPWSVRDSILITDERLDYLAKVADKGGLAWHSNEPVLPRSPTIIDVENSALWAMSPNILADKLIRFHQESNNVPVGVYGYIGTPIGISNIDNLEAIAEMSPTTKAVLEDILEYRRPIIEASDFINYDTYLLGKSWIDRDLTARSNYAAVLRKMYPTKPIIVWVWGRYHDAWQKPEDKGAYPIATYILDRYVKSLRESVDGVIVFDNRAERDKGVNDRLRSILGTPSRTRIPNNRAPNWANEIVPYHSTKLDPRVESLFIRSPGGIK